MNIFKKYSGRQQGFTLVELMIALVIAIFVMSAIAVTFTSQENTYHVQDQVVEMQQNLRAAMNIMSQEIRMANYKPLAGAGVALPGGIQPASGISIVPGETGNTGMTFTYEISNIGATQTILYSPCNFYQHDDPSVGDFCRQVGAGVAFPIAENIEWVQFLYFDEDGAPVPQPWTAELVSTIEFVQVSMRARSEHLDPDRLEFRTRSVVFNINLRN